MSHSDEQKSFYTDGGFATRAIHAGQKPDVVTGAVAVPISLATTFVQPSPGQHTGYEYSRSGNPTRKAFEDCVASLENAKYGLAFASGSAATASIINMLKTGDHVVTGDDVYGGTNRFFNKVATPTNGMSFSFVDLTVDGELEKALTEKTRLVWLETPTNPTLKIVDIEKAAAAAHAYNKDIIVVVDNTFASPALQNPLTLGADMVVHSVTKYINGHSDVVMGVVVTSDDKLRERLAFIQNSIGAVPAPFDCYLAMRGLKTLPLRMKAHSENATAVAQFLAKHEKVDKVIYPGLESHPQHAIARKQMRLFGGMVTVYLKGGIKESRQFLEGLHLIRLAESLGSVESLAEHPAIMTHAAVPPEQRKQLGISDSLVRLSVGVEDINDLIKDLTFALNSIQ
eukprot:TRINITY_DN66002_c3_g1_i1.p2 TRINITY_DN66002_c3_g1~~TRINITY_DN66002_c3_g1_i1.p2  ORF type:complete len:398 (-),score=262.35 TRINITY_DN66002_c3_g1_i1:1802-2995(-)